MAEWACEECSGHGRFVERDKEYNCPLCDGQGWYGVSPHGPTDAGPGTTKKVAVLKERYAAGIPLWHKDDPKERGEQEEHRVKKQRYAQCP